MRQRLQHCAAGAAYKCGNNHSGFSVFSSPVLFLPCGKAYFFEEDFFVEQKVLYRNGRSIERVIILNRMLDRPRHGVRNRI
jgi:hypothetical protein